MKRITQTILSVSIASWMIAAMAGFFTPRMQADSPPSGAANTTILYFLRHGEDVPEMVDSDPTFSVVFNYCNEDESCCVEALNPLGQYRAAELANWFERRRIAQALTHVIASHKLRTRQTVQGIAHAAGLGGDLDGDGIPDGTDVDQEPGDGVINIPPWPAECDPDWTSSSSVIQPQIDYINTLPLGSRAVVCSHSPAIYPIMEGFGIDTTDPVKFPRNAKGRVDGFNNLWIVQLKLVWAGDHFEYQGRLLQHLLLDLGISVSAAPRENPIKPSPWAEAHEQ